MDSPNAIACRPGGYSPWCPADTPCSRPGAGMEPAVVPRPAQSAPRTLLLAASVLGIGLVAAAVLALTITQLVIPSPSTTDGSNRTTSTTSAFEVHLMSRDDWLGRSPRGKANVLSTPVSNVILAHTAMEYCTATPECIQQVKRIQNMHMDNPKTRYFDIGYNFLVGGDGRVYEGRGWDAEGAHTHHWNKVSVGVALIGSFTNVTAPRRMQRAVRHLLDWGVSLGKLTADYGVMGACQVRAVASPGKRFMEDLRAWPHWRNHTTVNWPCSE